MYKVYLSGAIDGLTYKEADSWRQFAIANFNDNITALDPLRSKEWLMNKGVISAETSQGHWSASDEFIGTRDHWDTTRCDVMLVNLLGAKKVSIGTVLEIGMARAAGVKIILAMEDEGNVHEHCMIRNYATMRFNNLYSAIEATNALLCV